MVSVCVRRLAKVIEAKYIEVTKDGDVILHLANGTKKNVEITEIKFITD